VHQHSHTCVKGPLGHIGCRLSYPSNCANGRGISISELKLIPPNNNKRNGKTISTQNKNLKTDKNSNGNSSISNNSNNHNNSASILKIVDDKNKINKMI
jgi:hypothetical protein